MVKGKLQIVFSLFQSLKQALVNGYIYHDIENTLTLLAGCLFPTYLKNITKKIFKIFVPQTIDSVDFLWYNLYNNKGWLSYKARKGFL